MSEKCNHFSSATKAQLKSKGCSECEKEKIPWVALRVCITCGHVGCCESSVGRHAEKHYHETGHPVVEALQQNPWKWCYVHKTYN